MSNEEAYELLVKYSRDETTLLKIKAMSHTIGVEGVIEIMSNENEKIKGRPYPDDFKQWMR